AMAGLALLVCPVFREQHTDVHLVGLGLEPLEEAPHAVPGARPRFAPAHPLGLAFEDPGLLRFGQLPERRVQRHAPLLGVLLEIILAFLEATALAGTHCALAAR